MPLLILLIALHAPLPFPKPVIPPAIPGVYELTWHGASWGVTLHHGGTYEAVSPSGLRWLGEWKSEDGRLTVGESPSPGLGDAWPPASWGCTWNVPIPSGDDRRLSPPIRLKKVKKGK